MRGMNKIMIKKKFRHRYNYKYGKRKFSKKFAARCTFAKLNELNQLFRIANFQSVERFDDALTMAKANGVACTTTVDCCAMHWAHTEESYIATRSLPDAGYWNSIHFFLIPYI